MPQKSRSQQVNESRKEMDSAFKWLVIATAGIYSIFVFLIIWMFSYWISLGPLGNLPLAILPLVVIIAYTSLSLKSIPADKLATILFFGDPAKQVSSGLKFVPYLIADVQIDTRNYIQLVFGTPTESKEGETTSLKEATGTDLYEVREPLRITASGWKGAYYGEKPKGMTKAKWEKLVNEYRKVDEYAALGQTITIDPLLIARFRIESHPMFIKNIGSVRKVNRQIIDTSEAGLQAFVGRRTISYIQRSLDEANGHLTKRVEWLIGEPDAPPPGDKTEEDRGGWWGIDLQSVQVKSLGLPRRVNEAIADAVRAVSEKERDFQRAEAEKRLKIREGEGVAKAQELLLAAKAKGYKKVAEALKADEAKLIAQLEAMQTALSTGDNKLFLVGGKFEDIVDSLSGILNRNRVA